MISKLIHLWISLALLAGGLGLGQPIRGRAQSGDPTPPAPVRPGRFPARPGQPIGLPTPNGSEYRIDAGQAPARQAPNVLDEFGYTQVSVPLGWISAHTTGTDTGLSSTVHVTGAIPITFPFKFYENTYTQLWISAYGYLTFSDPQGYSSSDPAWMLISTPPNNMVAPYWSTFDLANSGPNNRV
jgi:hypothetical protein